VAFALSDREKAMSNVISFIGLRRGVGNSALARAFAVEAAWSLYSVVVDFDDSLSSTYDWAVRRDASGFKPSITVERGATFEFSSEDPGIELIMVDASDFSRRSAIELAKISRIVVISSTTETDDLVQVIDQMKAFSAAGLAERVYAALCRVQLVDDASSARATLAANNVRVLAGEANASMSYRRLEREGRALSESPKKSLAESVLVVIDSIQKAFVDGDDRPSL
jgi:hypothetical protein